MRLLYAARTPVFSCGMLPLVHAGVAATKDEPGPAPPQSSMTSRVHRQDQCPRARPRRAAAVSTAPSERGVHRKHGKLIARQDSPRATRRRPAGRCPCPLACTPACMRCKHAGIRMCACLPAGMGSSVQACVLPSLLVCWHEWMRACVHAEVQGCMLLCLHACILDCVHACVRACFHACLCVCVCVCRPAGWPSWLACCIL